jgi:hypothetical protein
MFMTLTRCKTAVHAFGLKLIEEKKQLLANTEKSVARDFLTLFRGYISPLRACHLTVPT